METPKSTCQLFNGDCLEIMHELEDDSIDLIFCDLPYGQTHCKWDSLIDLEKFWEQNYLFMIYQVMLLYPVKNQDLKGIKIVYMEILVK